MKTAWRAALAVALLLGVYVLALGISATLVVLAVFAWRSGVRGVPAGELIGVALFTTLGLVASVLTVTKDRSSLPGTVLDEERQRRLWAEVRGLASSVGTRPPDEIRLVPGVNAAVHEQTRVLGVVGGRRTMLLGAPLVLGFTRGQLRAVLAHELGHYSGRHTRLGAATYRGSDAIDHVVDHFGERSLVGRLFGGYARVYRSVSMAVKRQQEVEADDFSAAIAGHDVAAEALCEFSVVDAAWKHYHEHFLSVAHSSGRRPTDLYDGFRAVLHAPGLQEALATFRSDFDERPRGPFDSHPPLADRVTRLRAMAASGVPVDRAPAVELLDDPEQELHALQEWIYRQANLTAEPWSTLLRGHRPESVRDRAELLYDAARDVEHQTVSIGTLVESVRGRRLASYVRPRMEDPDGGGLQSVSESLLTAAVDEALMSAAEASFVLSWDADPVLVAPDGRTLDTERVVKEAVDTQDRAAFGSWLATQGVPLDYVPVFPEVDPRTSWLSTPAVVMQALAPIGGGGHLFCLVLSHGVLLRRPSTGDRIAWWTGGRRPAQVLLRRVEKMSGPELVEEARGTWLPWDRIASVGLARGRTRRPMIVITDTEGTIHQIKYRQQTRDTGGTLDALRFFLGDRVAA